SPLKMRSYEGLHDLKAMLDLLSDGRKANTGTYYVHPGDLQWWLFYSDLTQEVWQSRIRLWMEDDRLVGWALLSPEEDAFDVFIAPHLRGDSREHEMLAWAVNEMSALDEIDNVWVAVQDDSRIRWFEENGFACAEDHFLQLQRSLSGPLDGPPLPDGFSLRASLGNEEDARLRAAASHAAFKSGKPFEAYWPRTWKFNQSPVYVPEHELFVISPNGEIASFCIIWTDELNRLGHFEPVGTHHDFHRRGLGKCLLYEALRRLKAEGMKEADVCAYYDNHAAIGLYEAVGFRKVRKLLTYKKKRTT
ncbi:MAG TPA: GNAT family N-acetyltransferase, partial [Anaerolineales bacterium]|nr:GNAT family N-acetyltransferase [Anaerolineales bacterium]